MTRKKRILPEMRIDTFPLGIESAVIHYQFDIALKTLAKAGFEPISLEQNAQLRIQHGHYAEISKNSNLTREAVLYLPGETPKLVRNSPLLTYAEEYYNTYLSRGLRMPTFCCFSRDKVEESLTDYISIPDIPDGHSIPTNRCDSEAISVWAFGGEEKARAYGEFLRELSIEKMPVYSFHREFIKEIFEEINDNEDTKGNVFLEQVRFDYISKGYASGISRVDGSSGYAGLRGVKIRARETVPNFNTRIPEVYTPGEISCALKELGFSGLELHLLKRLKQ